MKPDYVTVTLWCTPLGPCITLDYTGSSLASEAPIRYPITHNEAQVWARWANDVRCDDSSLCCLLYDGWIVAAPTTALSKFKPLPVPHHNPHRTDMSEYDVYLDLNSIPLFKTRNP